MIKRFMPIVSLFVIAAFAIYDATDGEIRNPIRGTNAPLSGPLMGMALLGVMLFLVGLYFYEKDNEKLDSTKKSYWSMFLGVSLLVITAIAGKFT